MIFLPKTGLAAISDKMSSALSNLLLMIFIKNAVLSPVVYALNSAPYFSISFAISLESFLLFVPSKSMCSRKWEMPAMLLLSKFEPTLNITSKATDFELFFSKIKVIPFLSPYFCIGKGKI